MNPEAMAATQPELLSGESVVWAGRPNPRVIFHRETHSLPRSAWRGAGKGSFNPRLDEAFCRDRAATHLVGLLFGSLDPITEILDAVSSPSCPRPLPSQAVPDIVR
jgi:hypothetical protein